MTKIRESPILSELPSGGRKAESRSELFGWEAFLSRVERNGSLTLKSGAIVIEPICHFQTRYVLARVHIIGEFDPGSELTLAACLTHASRTRRSNTVSGERVSNTWVISPRVRNKPPKGGLILHNAPGHKPRVQSRKALEDEPASY